jgi:hypothetical protein
MRGPERGRVAGAGGSRPVCRRVLGAAQRPGIVIGCERVWLRTTYQTRVELAALVAKNGARNSVATRYRRNHRRSRAGRGISAEHRRTLTINALRHVAARRAASLVEATHLILSGKMWLTAARNEVGGL